MPRFGDLRHGVDLPTAARDSHQRWCGREIAIPQVVLEHLIVPHVLAGACIEGQHTVGVQVVAETVGTVEVVRRRAGGGEHHGPLGIDRDAGPGVGTASDLPRIGRPRFVAGLTGMRNGVKAPPQLAGVDVEGPNVTGGTRQCFGHRAADDEQVFEHYARRAGAHREPFHRTAESLTQVHPSTVAEGRDGAPGFAIEGVEAVAVIEDHAITGHHHAAMAEARGGRRSVVGIEAPDRHAGGGVERDDVQLGRRGIHHAIDHDRIRLHLRAGERVLGVVCPRHLQLLHVGRRDLAQRGVVRVILAAAVHGPVGGAPGGLGLQRGRGKEKQNQGTGHEVLGRGHDRRMR